MLQNNWIMCIEKDTYETIKNGQHKDPTVRIYIGNKLNHRSDREYCNDLAHHGREILEMLEFSSYQVCEPQLPSWINKGIMDHYNISFAVFEVKTQDVLEHINEFQEL